MPRKSHRIYDPTLSATDTMPITMEDTLGIGYEENNHTDDPLKPGAYYDDYDDQERQTTEIVDPRLHGLPLPPKKYKRCLWILLAVGVLAIIIAVSVQASKRNNNSSSSSVPGQPGYLVPPPLGLFATCAQYNIQMNPNELVKCAEMCQAAECCDYPVGLDLSCLENNQEDCLEYHQACAILLNPDQSQTSTITVPEAPSNLSAICNPDNFSSANDIKTCAQACVPYHCCYEPNQDGDGDVCSTEPNCSGYAPCFVLRAHDNIKKGIASEVLHKCYGPGPIDDCVEVCQVARCCFTIEGECAYKSNTEAFCNQYAACERLWGNTDDLTSSITDSPSMLATLNVVKFPTLEPTMSGTLEPTRTAMPTDESFGKIATSYFLPPLPDNITEVCGGVTSEIDDGFFQCDTLCMAAECCDFPEKFPQSCLGTQTDLCMEYSLACAVLDANVTYVTVELDILDKNLEDDTLGDVCSAESISYTFGLSECRKRCEPARCCWSSNYARCDDPRCIHYAPCLNLVAMHTDDEDIIETVQTACTSNMIASVTGRAVCEAVCLQHRCCYDDTCSLDDPKACAQYDGCRILYQEGSTFAGLPVPVNDGHVTLPTPTNLQDICAVDFMNDDNFFNDCAAACSAAECCNYPANMAISCLKGNEGTCFTYHKQCAALRHGAVPQDTTVVIEEAPANLGELCMPSSLSTVFGRTQCQTFCDAASCCWSEDIAASASCVDNANCQGYASCLNLRASSTNSTEIMDEIDDKCTIRQMMTPGGRQACDSVCLQHNCCWEAGEGSCFRNADCRQYDGCELLMDMDQDGTPDYTEILNPVTYPPSPGWP